MASSVSPAATDEPVSAPIAPSASAASLRPPPPSVGEERQQGRFAAIHALQQAGRSVSAIGRELGLSRVTVRKYLRAEACPARSRHSHLLGPGSPHVAYLRERWAAGCDNAAQLWAELRARGFTGSAGSVRRYLGAWRTTPRRRGRQPRPAGGRVPTPPSTPPSPRQVRWWLLQEPDGHPADQQAYLARLLRDCPTLQAASELARDFGRLLRQRDAPAFDPWLVRAERSGIAEFGSCARGMRQDYAAIAAALREPYSNGPTEGNVTRLKLVKRQMYGRAKPDLLRQRVLHRAS
jgi:transposase